MGIGSAPRRDAAEKYLTEVFASNAAVDPVHAISMAVEHAPEHCTFWVRWNGAGCSPALRDPPVELEGAYPNAPPYAAVTV